MKLYRNSRNIVQASEEEKFLFILPSATDVRALKDLALKGVVFIQSLASLFQSADIECAKRQCHYVCHCLHTCCFIRNC